MIENITEPVVNTINTTALGYYTFSDENLQKLWGTKYRKPIEANQKFLNTRKFVLSEHEQYGIDVNKPEGIDNPTWASIASNPDLKIYDHQYSTILKFVESISNKYGLEVEQKLEQFYTNQNNISGVFIQPEDFVITPGWVKYPYNSDEPISVGVAPGEDPREDVIVLDTETFVRGFPTEHSNPAAKTYKDGIYGFAAPVIATASTNYANYVWMHSCMSEENIDDAWSVELVQLPKHKKIIVLAFNSAYDISRIDNSYDRESNLLWFDLMSMVKYRRGWSTDQLGQALALKGRTRVPMWITLGCKSNLLDSYNLLCGSDYGKIAEDAKKIRDFFKEMTSTRELWDNLTPMLTYAQHDAVYTYRLAFKILPEFICSQGMRFTIFSHYTIAGSKVNVNADEYSRFLAHSENQYFSMLLEQQDIFDNLADNLYEDYKEGLLTEQEIEEDFWYSKLDWRSKGVARKTIIKFYNLLNSEGVVVQESVQLQKGMKVSDFLANAIANYPDLDICKAKLVNKEEGVEYTDGYGIPVWYWDRYSKGTLGLSHKTTLSHYLLRLTYLGSNLEKTKADAWINTEGLKPVHKKGIGKNVGCVLSKDQIPYYKSGDISSDGQGEYLEKIYEISEAVGFWTSTRKRALDKYVCPIRNTMMGEYIPIQTLSGRSGSRLWSVVPNPDTKKIGSDFKTMIRAREGYKILGTDFDG